MRTIPSDAIPPMEAFFRAAGRDGFESVVLFAGPPTPGGVLLDTLIFPKQRRVREYLGCSVEIPRDEVASLTSILRARGRALQVKIHTHPTDAYHSELDLANMLMQFESAISIVVPDFCEAAFDLHASDIAVYESRRWAWRTITNEWTKHLTIKPGGVTILDRTQ